METENKIKKGTALYRPFLLCKNEPLNEVEIKKILKSFKKHIDKLHLTVYNVKFFTKKRRKSLTNKGRRAKLILPNKSSPKTHYNEIVKTAKRVRTFEKYFKEEYSFDAFNNSTGSGGRLRV